MQPETHLSSAALPSAPKAGPLTLVVYTMIETLKAVSLADYYDLFADRIGFDKISNGAPVDNASP